MLKPVAFSFKKLQNSADHAFTFQQEAVKDSTDDSNQHWSICNAKLVPVSVISFLQMNNLIDT